MNQTHSLGLFPDEGPKFKLVSERELIRTLGVSRTTLWRMRTIGLPHVSVGRSVRYSIEKVRDWLATNELPEATVDEPEAAKLPILPCHWSPSVALDPKHRPQDPRRPSSTVRREWWRYPQEAHLLDAQAGLYRRLAASEICALQTFPAGWGSRTGLHDLDLIRGYGNAVPPLFAQMLFRSLAEFLDFPRYRIVEICAGFGGLALGAVQALECEHVALVENWSSAIKVLRATDFWPPERVIDADVREVDWSPFAGQVDVLCRGPPCQPWSNAGTRLGSDDKRDLLGFTPDLVRTIRPRAFVFENVPGFLGGDHQEYAEWLIGELRNSTGPNSYGVAAATFNSADFGVPQVRRRVFIVGIQNGPVRDVHRFFDLFHSKRTHGDPTRPMEPGRLPWRTIREAIPDWNGPHHQWRMWLQSSSLFGETEANPPGPAPLTSSNLGTKSDQSTKRSLRIHLQWPHRGKLPHWQEGAWHLTDDLDNQRSAESVPLVPDPESTIVRTDDPWYLTGDPMVTLDGLSRTIGRRVDFVYLDAPRIKTNAATFDAAAAQSVLDTWLTVVSALLRRSLRLLSDQGVFCALCGIDELPYVQGLLNEIAGPQNHIGTVAWQKGYSPRNLPNMRELSPTHDNLVLFARRRETIAPVALRIPLEGFANPDGDPRGQWNAEQKGANKPDCDYEVNICPYRWQLVEGQFPPGVWRVNEKTGVIWARKGDLKTAGTWRFSLKVMDRAGATAVKSFEITVCDGGQPTPPCRIPWLFAERDAEGHPRSFDCGGSELRIETESLPAAFVGHEYSAIVIASGGTPWLGTTRPGKTSKGGNTRYWEFPFKTLESRAAVDAVDFKKKDDAIPALKVYGDFAETASLNQVSVWLGKGKSDDDPFGAGYGQDAKKELQALIDRGIITQLVGTSKPAALLWRLVALFTGPESIAVDIGSPGACQQL